MSDTTRLAEVQTAVLAKPVETVSCNLIITRHGNSEVLLIADDGDGPRLPNVHIPRWERPAPHLTSRIRELWGFETVCLFSPRMPGAKPGERRSYVLEAVHPENAETIPESTMVWMPVFDASTVDSFAGQVEFLRALAQARAYDSGEIDGRFANSGWFLELREWLQSQSAAYGLQLGGNRMQYNMGPCFCLLRHETNSSAVWFKAVGEPNLREYAITATLSKLHSPYLPKVIAKRDDWRGWLMAEADGHPLDEFWALLYWRNAASSLARLQIDSMRVRDSLLDAGCKDLRVPHLKTKIRPLLDQIAGLMAEQPARPPRILEARDLRFLEGHLLQACDRMQALPSNNSLLHMDLNPGNVIVNGQLAVFLDWSEGAIGHPFFALEYLLALLSRLRPDLESWRDEIRAAYVEPWRALYSESQLKEASELTPLLAVFAFAAHRLREEQSPDSAELMRSLARRMYRVVDGEDEAR